ncbi:hypothetical protein DWF00_15435 [Bosea caraganae]|uniref:Uncharacterized protein n=2 Tax=Bosea caraganae TaxID=2763117 RepID=A0A370L6U0_9HYPH|nr:hypothetical protein DWE98_11950 [Bosea caraganae]RDJ25781.1 hypothetical protein DWF00_15435 [Bosea caraganae]
MLAFAASVAFAAEALPGLPKQRDYGQFRVSLIKQGWQPTKLPGADECWEGDKRCTGRAEMFACAGTGAANCLFIWKKAGTLIEVATKGEEQAMVSGLRCREGCK